MLRLRAPSTIEKERQVKRRSPSYHVPATLLPALLIGSLITAAPGKTQVREALAGSPAGWEELVERFEDYVEAGAVVGGSAVVVRDGEIVARHYSGHADLEAGVAVGPRTIYHWGSITKTLTAIAIMQLRDRGLLSLNDPVTRWVPELRRVHDPYDAIDDITLEMLLSHTSGFQNPTWTWTEGRDWEPFEPTEWAQLVAMMPYQELLFPPGSRYSYSNPAFIYLARVIESLTGDAWQAYVEKNILSPLGLARSYFGTTPYWLSADRSHNYYVVPNPAGGHDLVDNGADFDPGITIPNGGWNAPLDDLATYAAFLTGAARDEMTRRRHAAVLSRSTLEEMWQPRVRVTTDPADESSEDMGLSFFLVRRGNRSVIGHTGSQAGFRAFLYFRPEKRRAVILAFNTASEDPPEAARQALEKLLETVYAVVDP